MSWFANISIKRKLSIIILLTAATTLLVLGVAMIATEWITSRAAMVDSMTTTADLLGQYCVPVLSFHRQEDRDEAGKILGAVAADSHVVAACLYDKDQSPFGEYQRSGRSQILPAHPLADGAQFSADDLQVTRPVYANKKRIGTIYLCADLGRMYHQLALHAGIMALVLIGMILATFAVSPRIQRPISMPIVALAEAARQVASKKDYSVRVEQRGRDEVGQLAEAFNQMLGEIEKTQSSLQQANQSMQTEISERKTVEHHLKEQTQQIVESIDVLVSTSSEILASSSQFAAGAAETATVIAQTLQTIGELQQTAQLASQKSKSVSENAQRVAQTVRDGRTSTEATIEGMQRIRQQVESIAASMTRLSEQTQAIGQIIASVDDLAAQSNLLAVNASIEAARAGEQGKGFAVVAQEVRNLAEQSKQATNQVRGILNDVQKATGMAVMATEQGSKAVSVGVSQSGEARRSIETLSENVSEAADAATQIAASSQQQLNSVEQVVSAMETVKEASAQNASSAKMLEESAQELKQLGLRLKRIVAETESRAA